VLFSKILQFALSPVSLLSSVCNFLMRILNTTLLT